VEVKTDRISIATVDYSLKTQAIYRNWWNWGRNGGRRWGTEELEKLGTGSRRQEVVKQENWWN
jgi:hypothetical protein